MVYTTAQTTSFIKNPAQMGVSARTLQYLVDNEGLTFFHGLIDHLETDTWKQITDNMRCPTMIPDPANAVQMIHQAAFVWSAKSLGCLRIAAVAVLLFSKTYRTISADIMMYNSRLNNFRVYMDDIKENKKNVTNYPLSCLGIFLLKSTLKD